MKQENNTAQERPLTQEDLFRKQNALFHKYHKRMNAAAIVSSVCFGLAIGAGTAFLFALFGWLFSFGGVWLPVGTGLGAAVLSGFLLYFLKFRPTEADVVRRIDSMGLEERMVTMMELRGSNSEMAALQRADAASTLKNVPKQQVERSFPFFAIGKTAAIVMGVVLVAGIAMTTVNGLTDAGAIPSPGIVTPEREQFVTVTYLTEGDGEILDASGSDDPTVTEQILSRGENAVTVQAVVSPEDEELGWYFLRWSDGNTSDTRTDLNVTADLTVTAIFRQDESLIPEEGDGTEIDKDTDGDQDADAPNPDESAGAGSGGQGDGGQGDGDGAHGEGSGQGSGGEEGAGDGQGQGQGSGGGWSDTGVIIDGSTDYRDVFDAYYQLAMQFVQNNQEIPSDLLQFVEDYFNNL